MTDVQLARPAAVHVGAAWRSVVISRDQSEAKRPTTGFSIKCGQYGCDAHHEIPGPPDLPPDAVKKKFAQLNWFVSTGDWRKNRCPDHARRVPKPRTRTWSKADIPAAVDALFATPQREAKKPTPVARQPKPIPPPAPEPKPEPRHQPPPVQAPGLHGPHTLKTKVFAQIGIDTDLDKIHRKLAEMRRVTDQHLRQLDAMLLTVEDAQKRIGQYPAGRD